VSWVIEREGSSAAAGSKSKPWIVVELREFELHLPLRCLQREATIIDLDDTGSTTLESVIMIGRKC
jgi:hypothetical protein